MSSIDKVTSAPSRVHGLAGPQALAAAILGIVFWFLAALLIRYGLPAGLLSGWNRVILFLLTPVLTWGAIAILRRGVTTELPAAVSIATAAAAFCDVAAMTWAPSFYATDPADVLSGAILILWGVAWALTLSLFGWRER